MLDVVAEDVAVVVVVKVDVTVVDVVSEVVSDVDVVAVVLARLPPCVTHQQTKSRRKLKIPFKCLLLLPLKSFCTGVSISRMIFIST